jgi:signal transduction histidine kinase/ActR/RegA family two-component response regulator
MRKKGEKEIFLTYRMIGTALAIGVVLIGGIFAIGTSRGWKNGGTALDETLDFMKLQCNRYESMIASDQATTQVQLLDKAEELGSHMAEAGGFTTQDFVDGYAQNQRISGIVITDSALNEVMSTVSDSAVDDDIDWQQVLYNDNIAEIIAYPVKNYASRLQCQHGTVYDYVATDYNDGEGIILCYSRQMENKTEEQRQWLANLLSGYRLDMEGRMAITEDGVVISSNDDGVVGKPLDELGEIGSKVVSVSSEKCEDVTIDGTRYIAKSGSFRDYSLYVLFPLSEVYRQRSMVMAYVIIFYILCLMILYMFRQKEIDGMNRQKMDFLHQVSHDIRTPINGIRGMVMIGDSCPDDIEKQTECRRKIWEASDLLLDLINDVLDVGRLENGNVKLEEITFDISEFMDNVVAFMATQAKAGGLELKLDGVFCEHTRVVGSPFHVRRVLDNLISNAIKYNNEGGSVTLSCRELKGSVKDGVVYYEFVCSDTGIGMSHEFQKHMFERFTQEKNGGEQSHHGTGLGLAIVSELVQKMKGSIRCESEPGKGTSFYVTLPFKLDEQAGQAQEKSGAAGEEDYDLTGVSVLLVEDNELNMEIAEFLLEDEGASVTEAWDGREAVEVFEKSMPGQIQVILMDIMMPVMDGKEAARAIRKLDRKDASTVPIIAMTANAFEEDADESIKAGMNAHLSKPIDVMKLKQEIYRCIH